MAALLALLVSPHAAWALVDGEPHALYASHRVFGRAVVTGNTLMSASIAAPEVNSGLLPRSGGDVRAIPFDGEIAGAYLFWSGSIADRADRNVTLFAPGGERIAVAADRCVTVPSLGGFFYCRADVSDLVRGAPGPQRWNGRWEVGDVEADPGTLDRFGECVNPQTCQAKYAAWSLVLVYEAESARTLRDVFIHDGFRQLDETPRTPGIDQFDIRGFDFPRGGQASVSYFALEGDSFLGVPPQDTDPVFPCQTCFDFFEFGGSKLNDANNPANNLFNSSSPGGFTLGLDLDTFDVSGLLSPGDRQVRVRVGSGDGIVNAANPDPSGGGESFFLGYVLLNVDRNAPNFRRDGTLLSVVPDEGAPRERVVITLSIDNEGTLDAANTIATLRLPDGLTYFPGSLRVDGADPVPGEEVQNPLANGLRLGNVPFQGDSDRLITFRATIDAEAMAGQRIRLRGNITSDSLDGPVPTNVAELVILGGLELGQVTKAVTDSDGDDRFVPGEVIQYAIAIPNPNARDVGGVRLDDQLPPYLDLLQVITVTGIDRSRPEENRVILDDMTIPGNGSARITILARIHDTDQLLADGVEPGALNGLLVRNRASVIVAGETLRSDDPTTAANDATDFRLSAAVDITGPGTRKLAVDVNGGLVEPGDQVRYTIEVANAGARAADVFISDPLPEQAANDCVIEGAQPDLICANGRLQGIVRVAAGATARVVFTVRIDADAPNGTRIQNVANVRAVDDAAQQTDLRSPVLRVVAAPVLGQTSKSLVGVPDGIALPGERVQYRITVPNTGNRPATGVVIRDPLPNFPFAAVEPGDGGVLGNDGVITWNLPDIAPGAEQSVTFSVTLPAMVENGTVIANQATVAANELRAPAPSDDLNTAEPDDPTRLTVRSQARLVAEKTVDAPTHRPGEVVTYRFTVRNTGTDAGRNVVLRDPLPAGVFAEILPEGGRVDGGAVIFDAATTPALARLAVGDSVDLVVRARLLPVLSNGLPVENQATVSGADLAPRPSDDPATPVPDDPTRFTIESAPALAITKAVTDLNGGQAQPGDLLRYTFELTNTGDAPAEEMVLDDPLPAQLTDAVASDGGVVEAGRVIWRFADPLMPGAPRVVTLDARIGADVGANTPISNQASLVARATKPVLSDDPATPEVGDPTIIRVVRRPDFATSTKTADARDVLPGDQIRWTLTIRNSGALADAVVNVVDPIPEFLEVVDAGGGVVGRGEVRWSLADVQPGEERVLTLVTRVVDGAPGGTDLANQARIVGRRALETVTDDPTTAEDDDPTIARIRAVVLVEAQKTVTDDNGAPARPGDLLAYRIRLTNRGTVAATKVQVRDPLPAGLALVKAPGAEVMGDTLTWQLGELAAGASRELTFTAQVEQGLANGALLANQAQVGAANLDDPVLTDDPATAEAADPTVVQVISSADFSTATKRVEAIDDGFRPGNRVRYLIEFTNTGDGAAVNAIASDPLPPELTDVEAEGPGVIDIRPARVRWQIGNINPGQTVRLQVTGRIVAPLDNGTVVANRAQISGWGFAAPFLTDDPSTPAVDSTDFVVVAEPRPTLAKTLVTEQPVRAGDAVEYRLTLGNDGDAAARGLIIRDRLPAELVNPEVDGPARVVDGVVEWPAPAVNPGETVTLSVRANVPPKTPDGTAITNRATGPDGLESDDPSTPKPDATTFVVQNRADIARVDKTVVGDFEPGGQVTYTIVVANRGNLAANEVVVTDRIPAGLNGVATEPAAEAIPGGVRWQIRQIPPRSEVRLIMRGTVDAGLADGVVITNQATTEAANAAPRISDDPTTDAPDDPTRFTVRNRPVLEVVKSVRDDNGGAFVPGDTLSYGLTVTNTGNRAAPAPTLRDRIPNGLIDARPVDGVIEDGIAIWQLADLPPGEQVTVTLRARVGAVPDGTTVINAFEASFRGQPEPVVSDAVRFTVRTGTLTVQKTARPLDPVGFAPGAQLEYQLRITNPSPVAVRDVFIEDPVPVRFLQGFEPSDGGVFDAVRQVVEWTPARSPVLGEIGPGETVVLTLRAQIRPALQPGEQVSNQAVATPRAGVATPSDDPATAASGDPTVFVVAGAPVYSVLKVIAAPRGVISAGAEVTYEIQVRNRGTVAGPAPVLSDQLPEGVEYVRESTTLDGAPVPDRGGRPPLEAGVGLRGRNGVMEPGDVATARFNVRVPDGTPAGTRIDNQAFVEDGAGADALSDDPDTPELNDPTSFVVGGGANIDRIIKTARVIGRDGDRAAVGDTIEWTIQVNNAGDAPIDGITLFDEIPTNSRYEPGSITVDGAPQTDAIGDDIGEKRERAVVARLGDVPARGARTVTFRTTVTAGPQVANQARILRRGDVDRLSDDDGQGNDPTVVRVGDLPVRSLRIRKTVSDPTEPPALAGETLIYRINLQNDGTVDLANLTVIDDLQPGLLWQRAFDLPPGITAEFEPAPAGAFQNGRVRFTGAGVVAGDTIVLPMELRVDPALPDDRELCNIGQAEGPGLAPVASEPVCVQAEVRFGDIGGRVFEDADRSGEFTEGADRPFEGMIVRFYPAADPDGRADAEAITDATGRYDLSQVRPGNYRVRVFSKNEVLLETQDGVEVSGVEQRTQNLIIDPSGRVYDSVEGTLIDGAEVFIYRDADLSNDDPLDEASRRARVLVPPEDLEAESQQGQRTAHGGMYRFAVRRPGRYFIEVVPPGTAWHAPSILTPVTPGFAFTVDPERRVVPDPIPSVAPDADRTHFLAFDLQGPEDEFFHNHIPIDPLSALIDVEKRALKTQITRGQILTYQVDIINRSPRDLVVDDSGTGGVILQDVLPKGFKYIAGSALLTRISGGKEITLAGDDPSGARILRFGRNRVINGETVAGAFDLHAGESLRLRYQVALGSNVKAREVYTNRATLLTDGNIAISRTATADVRVMPDADFDQGFLFGKVWCDADKDGKQSEGEAGLAGVRLYLDNGWYAETDSAGKYHFKDIDPGSHAIKIDSRTLLPGAEMTTDEVRVVYFSRGLPAKVGFGVTCPGDTVEGAAIEVGKDGMTAGLKLLRERYAVVSGNAKKLQVRVDDAALRARAPKVRLLVDGAPAKSPDLPVGGDGAAASLTFETKRPKGAPRDRWALWVGEIGGEEQQVRSGDGRIPRKIEWDQRGADGKAMLQSGKNYQFRVEMGSRDGTVVGSKAGVFGVGVKGADLPPLIERMPADFRRGAPARAVTRRLGKLKDKLTAVKGKIRVEVHAGTAEQTETQAEAEALVAALVKATGLPAERFEAAGLALERPIAPTAFARSATLNRRVELRAMVEGARVGPAKIEAEPSYESVVRVDAESVVPEADGSFALTAEVPPDGVVEVFVQAADGSRAALPLKIKKGVASKQGKARRVVVEGTPPKGLRVGGVKLRPSGLKVKVKGPKDPVALGDGAFASAVEFKLRSGLKRAARWRFSVVDAKGEPVFERAAEGQPPKSLLWDGKGIKSGAYRYRLTVRSTRQVIGQSAERTLLVGDAKAPRKRRRAKKKNQIDGWSLRVDGLPVPVDGDRFYANPTVRGEQALLIELTRPDGGRSVFFAAPPSDRQSADDAPKLLKAVAPAATSAAPAVGGGPVPKRGRSKPYRGRRPKLRKPLPAGERARFSDFGRDELTRVLLPAVGDTGADVPARQITVTLPAKGATLNGRAVPISGKTAPGNRVLLAGTEAIVDSEGNFSGSATLEPGAAEIVITTIDPLGNRGVIRRPVVVPDGSWFLLAFGESQLGKRGAELAGVESATSTTVGDTLYLHGRAAVYFKGYQKGSDILGGLFEKYEVTAHLDTARRREFETYFRQVVDPEQFYPVYGDSAAEVKEANTRGPLYVMVQADRSRLTVGNFRSAMRGIELLNYDRSLYGAAAHLDVKTKQLRHEVRAFAADQEIAERHGYVEYRGTGGSLYYLPHREVVEGSERIYLVERDKLTNHERARVALNRDIDYTIRYDDGRILLKTPAPTTNLNVFGPLPQPGAGNVLDGHPVFISVEYDHRDPGNFGDTAYGVHVRETLNDAVTIGGGYIEEGRNGSGRPDYKLWGGELRLRYSNRTRLDAEVARSQSINGENLLSDDGGLTFSPFNLRDGARSKGTSFLLRGGLELDDIIGDGKKKHWYNEAYWQYIAAGFYAGGTIQQQGLETYGVKSRYWINDHHAIFVQHDGTQADEPQTQGVSLFRAFRREITRAGYSFVDTDLKVEFEFVHTQSDEDGESPIFVTDALSIGSEYKVNGKWTLIGEQEVVIVGDERLHQSTGDLLATSVGARYRAGANLSFEAIETLRWSGDNATQLGVRTEIDERHALYANQRFAQRAQDMVATTVVGGEERFGKDKSGRAFGEYQLDTGSQAGRSRAVMGVGKRTQVVKGLTIDAAYQRSQVLGGPGGQFSQDSISLGVEWLDNDKVKIAGRYELRYDDNDEDQGRRDRFQVLALNTGAFKLHRDLSLLLRFNYSHTFDLAIEATEAELVEGSFGLAFRPVRYDWVAVIAKYTKRYEQRPIDVLLEQPEREEIDVISLVPIFELPYNLQLVGKFALKRTALRTAFLPTISDQQVLAITRLNYHLTKTWDIGGEYRWLNSQLAQTTLNGAMFELNYIVKDAVRLGVGYNFTSFSDDEFARLSEDHGGAFIRVIGQY